MQSEVFFESFHDILTLFLQKFLGKPVSLKDIWDKVWEWHALHATGEGKKYILQAIKYDMHIFVSKKTILPSENTGFVLHLNKKHDVDKLQKLQNRSLRMCFDIINPRDVTVLTLYEMANTCTTRMF